MAARHRAIVIGLCAFAAAAVVTSWQVSRQREREQRIDASSPPLFPRFDPPPTPQVRP